MNDDTISGPNTDKIIQFVIHLFPYLVATYEYLRMCVYVVHRLGRKSNPPGPRHKPNYLKPTSMSHFSMPPLRFVNLIIVTNLGKKLGKGVCGVACQFVGIFHFATLENSSCPQLASRVYCTIKHTYPCTRSIAFARPKCSVMCNLVWYL